MKIQPQKNCKIPKYAAALAAVASAAMLTACHYDGEMAAPEGTAPAPADSVVIYDGEAPPDEMLRTEGEGSVAETEPEQTEQLAGEVAVEQMTDLPGTTEVTGFVGMSTIMSTATTVRDDDELILDGGVVCVPDTETETTAAVQEEGVQP